MKRVARLFKLLGNPLRLRIVNLLLHSDLYVCEISYLLKASQSSISHHLAKLRDFGLIVEERKGKWILYKWNKNSEIAGIKEFEKALKKMLSNSKESKIDIKNLKNYSKTADLKGICKTAQ